MKKENLFTIPNFLSGYRMLVFPVILWTILSGRKDLFFGLLIINLVTDILDGIIARTFRMETEIGAKLDSFADLGTYILAFTGMIVLEKEFIYEYRRIFFVILGFYALPQLVSLLRFRRPTSFHLYSSKITGYLQGVFILIYYLSGLNEAYFYFMCAFSISAYAEALVIVLFIPELRSNVKGLLWMFREKGGIK